MQPLLTHLLTILRLLGVQYLPTFLRSSSIFFFVLLFAILRFMGCNLLRKRYELWMDVFFYFSVQSGHYMAFAWESDYTAKRFDTSEFASH